MKIAYLCRNYYRERGGIETYVREISRFMAAKGHTVHIIAQDYGDLPRGPLTRNIQIHLVKMKLTPFHGYWGLEQWIPLDDLRFAWKVAKKIRQLTQSSDLDVVESMDYFRQGFYTFFFSGVPMVHRLHGWMFNRQDARVNPVGSLSFKEKLLWHMQHISLKNSDLIVSVSQDFADRVANVWPIPRNRIKIFPNAIDEDRYNFIQGNKREPAVIFAARLSKNKGVKVLADAIPLVLADHPDVKFYFVGKDCCWNEEGRTASEYISSKAPKENVIFLGEIHPSEIIAYYHNCSVCVLPSFYESFGITALEAMACGCTMVASRTGGLKEIITDGKNGLLVEPGDAAELAKAIGRLLDDPQERSKLSSQGAETVHAQYTYKKLIERQLTSYQETIESRKGHCLSQMINTQNLEIPEISVVLPVYNRAGYVTETLESIEAQLLEPREVIIVDDASTDNSVEVIKHFAARSKLNIMIISNEHKKGQSGALNTGIGKASSKLIAFHDSDDIWTPIHLKQLALAMKHYPQVVMAFSAIEIFGEAQDVERKKQDFKESVEQILGLAFNNVEKDNWISNDKLFYGILKVGFPFRCQSSLVRKDFIRGIDLLFDEDITYTLDSQFVTIASYHGAFLYVDTMGTRIRRHEENDNDSNYGTKIEDSYEIRVLKLKEYFKGKKLTPQENGALIRRLWTLQEEVAWRRSRNSSWKVTIAECINLVCRVPAIWSLKSAIKIFISRLAGIGNRP